LLFYIFNFCQIFISFIKYLVHVLSPFLMKEFLTSSVIINEIFITIVFPLPFCVPDVPIIASTLLVVLVTSALAHLVKIVLWETTLMEWFRGLSFYVVALLALSILSWTVLAWTIIPLTAFLAWIDVSLRISFTMTIPLLGRRKIISIQWYRIFIMSMLIPFITKPETILKLTLLRLLFPGSNTA